MIFKVKAIPEFEKEVKKLLKKYPSLKDELIELIESLETNPNQGTQIFKNCFKIMETGLNESENDPANSALARQNL